MTTRICLFLLFVTIAFSSAISQKRNPGYQRHFGAEESITKPARVPDSVFRQVLRNGADLYVDETTEQFKKRIQGTFVDLDSDGKRDFLVQGDNGANTTGFWLFRNVNGKYKLVLHTRALGLWITSKRSRGPREVEAGAATATSYLGTRYRFMEGRYRPVRCWEENLEEVEATRKKRYRHCR